MRKPAGQTVLNNRKATGSLHLVAQLKLYRSPILKALRGLASVCVFFVMMTFSTWSRYSFPKTYPRYFQKSLLPGETSRFIRSNSQQTVPTELSTNAIASNCFIENCITMIAPALYTTAFTSWRFPVRVGVVSQRLIPTGIRPGLSTCTATTESV